MFAINSARLLAGLSLNNSPASTSWMQLIYGYALTIDVILAVTKRSLTAADHVIITMTTNNRKLREEGFMKV